jgi:hypothetical protein
MAKRDISATLPPSLAIGELVVPIREIGDTLILATSRMLPSETDSRLRFVLNRNVRFVLRSPEWIAAKLREYYDNPSTENGKSADADSIAWYWPEWHSWNQSTLVVKVSGWSNGVHWTGAAEYPPTHNDHAFWAWLVKIPQYHRLVDESEIPSIKRIWNRYCRRTSK